MVNELLLKGRLTERDIAVIQSVWNLGLMSSRQIARLHFPATAFSNEQSSRRVAQRRLKCLNDWGLLARKIVSPYAPHSYLLAAEGGRLIKIIQGARNLREVWTPDDLTDALISQPHRDEIVEFVITLTEALRSLGVTLTWQGERQSQITCLDGTYFRPDGVGVMSLPASTLYFFFEWDRGTETMRHIWIKARNYLKFYSNRKSWNPDYNRFPPLIFITTGGSRRRDNMVIEIERQMTDTRTEPTGFVALVGCQADLDQLGILGDVFIRAGAKSTPPISLLGSAKAQLVRQASI